MSSLYGTSSASSIAGIGIAQKHKKTKLFKNVYKKSI
jgi:hypothetical protein